MAFKVGKDKKIRASKSKNTKELEFREEESMDADAWFKHPHLQKFKKQLDKIKFKK